MTGRTATCVVSSILVLVAGCGPVGAPSPNSTEATDLPPQQAPTTSPVTEATEPPQHTETSSSTVPQPPQTTPPPNSAFEPPPWLGTRVLELRSDGYGRAAETPPELIDRRIATVDYLPPPASNSFEWSVGPVTPAIASRSTWHEGCPVPVEDLRYLTVSFWGFDELAHTGELVVHADVARDLARVFGTLYEARFPIEKMRIDDPASLGAPPTGDGNNTTAFVCRRITGGSNRWSEHAYGRALDINPFHNPYRKGDLVLPELASAYLDRERILPGIIEPDGVVVEAFTAIGWVWGGTWRTIEDYHHFSASGG